MGRRPGIKSNNALEKLTGQNPEVQKRIDDITCMFFDEVKTRMKDKIDAGAFKRMTAKELMSEFRGVLRGIQRPATSLQQINIPQTPQIPQSTKRTDAIQHASKSPEERQRLRHSAKNYLEHQGE